MKPIAWSLADMAAQLLKPDEREAVLGDLTETSESAWQALIEVLGLVFRRHAALWKGWRPWFAALGMSLPGSFLLMGISLSFSGKLVHAIGLQGSRAALLAPNHALLVFICQGLLLLGWSWTGGFAVSSLSRRTLWASIAFSCFACLFCLMRYRESPLPSFCLLVFLAPAIWGACQGVRIARIKLGTAIVLTVTMAVLMITAWMISGLWLPNCVLALPTAYMLATAWGHDGSETALKRRVGRG